MDEIKKGMKINMGKEEVTLTKVSRCGLRGVMDGNKKVGDKGAITPVYRLYYKRIDGTQGHTDAAINRSKFNVVVG